MLKQFIATTFLSSTIIFNSLNILPVATAENQKLLNDFLNSPASNGLLRDMYPDFFREGRVLIEREIEILQKQRTTDETLLEINPKVEQIQEQLSPFEENKLPLEN
jgi:hypothetical protein